MLYVLTVGHFLVFLHGLYRCLLLKLHVKIFAYRVFVVEIHWLLVLFLHYILFAMQFLVLHGFLIETNYCWHRILIGLLISLQIIGGCDKFFLATHGLHHGHLILHLLYINLG